jgi:hypothetical protein
VFPCRHRETALREIERTQKTPPPLVTVLEVFANIRRIYNNRSQIWAFDDLFEWVREAIEEKRAAAQTPQLNQPNQPRQWRLASPQS